MQKYKYVVVIGIDGMGGFNRLTDTPCMDRIFESGAYTYNAMSMDPTISAENWGGMLIGCDPAVHRLTNGYISSHPYTNKELPSLFSRIRKEMPDAYLASAVNWNPINIGIVEDGISVDKRTAGNDALVTEEAIECIAKKPVFLFVQLDEVDGAGHHFGYGTQGHLDKITEIDSLVGKMYDKYAEAGIIDETLFICIADHGGHGHGHGGWTDTEKYIFFGVSGRGVKTGRIEYAVTKDISASVLYALGIDIPAYTQGGYTSQVPAGIFDSVGTDYIKPLPKSPSPRRETAAFDSPGGLGEIFGGRVKLCMFFDSSSADETGNFKPDESGSVKFYSNGIRGETAEFGATGAYIISGADFSRSFSLSFWLLADADIEDEICVLGNKSPENGKHREKGFNVLLRNHSVKIQLGSGDDDTDTVTAFGADGFSGWVNVSVSFDYENSEIKTVIDFDSVHIDRADPVFFESIKNGGDLIIGDDLFLEFNKNRNLIFRMDDLIMLDGVLTVDDIAFIKEYYM